VVSHPGPPQIPTCALNASGASSPVFAEWHLVDTEPYHGGGVTLHLRTIPSELAAASCLPSGRNAAAKHVIGEVDLGLGPLRSI